MKNISNYFKKNKLKMNVNKTKAMMISNKKVNTSNVSIKIDNEIIEFVSEIKYLGVIIDSKLNFEKHVDYICKKASRKVGVLNRIKNKIKTEQRICLYKSIIAPHFEYCPTIIFLLNETQIARLQKIQNRAMRAVMRVNRRTSIKLMLDTLGWLSVRQRSILLTLQFIHKIKLGLTPNYLCDILTKNSERHNYNLRNVEQFAIPNYKKKSNQNSLFYKGLQLYNGLNEETKNENRLKIFINETKKWIKSNINV